MVLEHQRGILYVNTGVEDGDRADRQLYASELHGVVHGRLVAHPVACNEVAQEGAVLPVQLHGERSVTEYPLGSHRCPGAELEVCVPAGHWQSACPAGDEEVLVSCLVTPGFDFADFTLLPPT
ncbi:cupin domain-containing protein [Streptomyces sp. NPDC127051]|uniref:cupin domain-containing protein n=1 Tax=Streptomyces sp. NPDC127051 TaxID=3347119 RepID=UPI00364AFB61